MADHFSVGQFLTFYFMQRYLGKLHLEGSVNIARTSDWSCGSFNQCFEEEAQVIAVLGGGNEREKAWSANDLGMALIFIFDYLNLTNCLKFG